MNESTSCELEQLAVALYDAKQSENVAKEKRIQVEERIAALVDGPESGSKTVSAGKLKLTVKRGITYKADLPRIQILAEKLDGNIPVKFVPGAYVFDEKRYEALREDNPAAFAQVAKHVTTKPKKTSVSYALA